jgi:hypothetical protein
MTAAAIYRRVEVEVTTASGSRYDHMFHVRRGPGESRADRAVRAAARDMAQAAASADGDQATRCRVVWVDTGVFADEACVLRA